jgi:MoaA/NifB/PqqE/SkfB family radical SAM enzyme
MKKIELKNLQDNTSNTFCMAKFHEATIWLYNGKIASCHHNPFHNVGNTVETFYNTSTKRDQQYEMLNGGKPKGCDYCWKLEEKGAVSDREIKSLNYSFHLDPNSYLNVNYNFKPNVLELAFQKTCNLGCSYCNADFSTQWVNDIKNNGIYDNILTDQRKHYQRPITDYKDDPVDMNLFWQWFDTVVEDLEIIRVTGGEPLLHEETFDLFEKTALLNPKIKIAINTNLCQKPLVINRFIDKVCSYKNVIIYTSNESSGEVAEYLRDGMNYDEWLSNLKLVSQHVNEIGIMTTIGAIALQTFDQFILDISNIRKETNTKIELKFNFLTYPKFQSFDSLTALEKQFYYIRYNNFFESNKKLLTDFEIIEFKKFLMLLNTEEDTNQIHLRNDLINFNNQYSVRREKKYNFALNIGN